MNLTAEFRKLKFERTTSSFQPKRVEIVSGSHNTAGVSSNEYFKAQSAEENKKHLEELFKRYAHENPFKPSALCKRLKANPTTMMQGRAIEQIELEKWREKGKQYAIKFEPKTFKEMIMPTSMHGIKGDKKPRGNAKLSSSWVRAGSGNNMKSKNTIVLNLNGKEYTYGVTDWHTFSCAPSIGRLVNTLRKQGAGATCWGLKKLY